MIGNIWKDATLVIPDVVGLYLNISYGLGLKALEVALEKRESMSIPTSEFVEMAKFVLQNNYFKFNVETKQQISGTATDTIFAPLYACIFMSQAETEVLKTQTQQPLVWFRYIDNFFFF